MRSIFISGGAEGIGKAVALRFLEAGWKVGAYDIQPVTYTHPELRTGYLDVTDAESWQNALADFAEFAGGSIDVLDNNAGIIAEGPLAELDDALLKAQINVNITGLTLGAKYAKPYLRETLINMSSASALYGQPGIAVYSASKFYVAGLTEALGLEWKDVRVVAIWPLWAKTKLADVRVGSTRKLGVRLTPEQVAEVVYRAANPRNRWERGKIHYGVSTLDKALSAAGEVLPTRIARAITRILT